MTKQNYCGYVIGPDIFYNVTDPRLRCHLDAHDSYNLGTIFVTKQTITHEALVYRPSTYSWKDQVLICICGVPTYYVINTY